MDFSNPEIIGFAAVALGIVSQGIYLVSIFQGKTKPHLFTWLVWTIISGIGYAAQVHDNAGPGAWVMGLTCLCSAYTAILCLKYGEKTFTRGDKIALCSSLFAILPWMMTEDPLGSVILISIIDVVAFYPTIRKSWMKPDEENLTSYNLASGKLIISVFAMTNLTVTTALYPVAIVFINTVFVVMCLVRRKKLQPQ